MPTFIKPFLPEICAAILCISCTIIGYIKGNSNCELSHAQGQIIGVKERGKIEEKNMSLDDSRLNDHLSHWLR